MKSWKAGYETGSRVGVLTSARKSTPCCGRASQYPAAGALLQTGVEGLHTVSARKPNTLLQALCSRLGFIDVVSYMHGCCEQQAAATAGAAPKQALCASL
jgi:hypothetical protein